jgi:hypothetical protein
VRCQDILDIGLRSVPNRERGKQTTYSGNLLIRAAAGPPDPLDVDSPWQWLTPSPLHILYPYMYPILIKLQELRLRLLEPSDETTMTVPINQLSGLDVL